MHAYNEVTTLLCTSQSGISGQEALVTHECHQGVCTCVEHSALCILLWAPAQQHASCP